MTTPRLRQPYYCITSSPLCQALFSIFQNLFLLAFAPIAFPRQLFSLSWAAFCAASASVSLRQLCYFSTPSLQCQVFFSVFFGFFHPCGSCCISLNDSRHFARAFSSIIQKLAYRLYRKKVCQFLSILLRPLNHTSAASPYRLQSSSRPKSALSQIMSYSQPSSLLLNSRTAIAPLR